MPKQDLASKPIDSAAMSASDKADQTGSQPSPMEQSIAQRFIRFDAMIPCKTAFIDARTPGSDKKENFCLIGAGVAENPDQVVHIDIPHGFNVGAARQPKGCKNSHHSHDTEEVFMIFSGQWLFTWGETGNDGQVVLGPGDTISLPKHMFRGFENVGDGDAFMFSILGLDQHGSAGQVVWAPYVFEQARDHGLVLLEDGRLIDLQAGQSVPENSPVQTATTAEQAAQLVSPDSDAMANCLAMNDELAQLSEGGLSSLEGVNEYAVIGVTNSLEQIDAGKISTPHGFQLRRLHIAPGAAIPAHRRGEEEVLIVQAGNIQINLGDQTLTLTAGDLLSVPIAMERSLNNTSDTLADLIVIRRGDNPSAAEFM